MSYVKLWALTKKQPWPPGEPAKQTKGERKKRVWREPKKKANFPRRERETDSHGIGDLPQKDLEQARSLGRFEPIGAILVEVGLCRIRRETVGRTGAQGIQDLFGRQRVGPAPEDGDDTRRLLVSPIDCCRCIRSARMARRELFGILAVVVASLLFRGGGVFGSIRGQLWHNPT
jgi:hypothetical protein